jgi:hypothetical protein
VRFLPTNFGTDRIGAKLADPRLDAAKPILVSWLGVTQYLTLDASIRRFAPWHHGVADRTHLHHRQLAVAGRGKGGDGESAGAGDKFRRTIAVEILRGRDRRPASMAGFFRVEPFTNAARRVDGLPPLERNAIRGWDATDSLPPGQPGWRKGSRCAWPRKQSSSQLASIICLLLRSGFCRDESDALAIRASPIGTRPSPILRSVYPFIMRPSAGKDRKAVD